tara:strand:+ start:296 stop:718 length:423 start_codon:yes stop_codon:yes gene_type:complete
MKLAYITLILLFFLTNCASIVKPHGYQLEDILQKEALDIGIASKNDLMTQYGSPSVKIEDVGNTWLYIGTAKEKKVFSRDEFKAQVIFAFNFDSNDILISQEIYDKDKILDLKINTNETYNYGTNYSILDQLYDAFTRGL